MQTLLTIARQFAFGAIPLNVTPLGSGIINDTYRVQLDNGDNVVLQRINQRVFSQPDAIMQNVNVVQQHIQSKLSASGSSYSTFYFPKIYKSKKHQLLVKDSEGEVWRAMELIADTVSYNTLEKSELAAEIGNVLGMFHSLLSDLPVDTLLDTLPEFHITPHYLSAYDLIVKMPQQQDDSIFGIPLVNDCIKYVQTYRYLASVLENAKAKGRLASRVIHGDPKLNNVLFQKNSNKAVSIIDLDTVKPGLVHYDIGDCLRSSCNLAGEKPDNLDDVQFDIDICRQILQSYFKHARQFMTDMDYDYIIDAIKLIPFELGLRFFSDYLQGNKYFKIVNENDNLIRAKVQFRLLDSVVNQEKGLMRLLDELK